MCVHGSQVVSVCGQAERRKKENALVSENTIDSKPVRSRCACTEVGLCLSVDKLKEEKKRKQQGRNDVSVQRSMSM